MAERDKYDKDILKALQKIGKHLESIDKKLTTGAVIPIVEGKKKSRQQWTVWKGDNMSELKDSLLISIDILSGEDKALLIVGKKKLNKPVDIINAFEGEDAIQIYKMLITKKS